MDYNGYLTIRDLMNFNYCPRLIYFENVLRLPQATTIKEMKGRELHEMFSKKSTRNKLVRELPKLPKIYNVNLVSKQLQFRTVLDCVIVNKEKNEAYPIEYKDSKKPQKLYRSLRMQIVAESFLVIENLKYNVPYAFIKFEQSGDLVKIDVTENELEQMKQDLSEINRIVKDEKIPEPTEYPKRCTDCRYWKICRRA